MEDQPTVNAQRSAAGACQRAWHTFDIHGLVRMRVAANHPSARAMLLGFGPFVVGEGGDGECDLELVSTLAPPETASDASNAYRFAPGYVLLRDVGVAVGRRAGRFTLAGERDLMPYVLPLIHWLLLLRGHTFVHAAAVELDGCGVLMPAWGGTGKTSAVIKLLQRPAARFVSDDLALLSAEAELLSFAKPFFIYPYHRHLFPHLFRRKHKPLVPPFLSGAMATVRQAVRPALMAFPRLEAWARRLTPEHMQVPAREALPGAEFAARSKLGLIVFLEKFSGTEVVLDQLDAGEAARRIVGNYFFEIGGYAREIMIACGATGLPGLDEWLGRMRAVIDKALAGRPVHRLRLPQADAEQTGRAIRDQIVALVEQLPASERGRGACGPAADSCANECRG